MFKRKFALIVCVFSIQMASWSGNVFHAGFDSGFDAFSKAGKGKANQEGSGVIISDSGLGCPVNPAGKALDQQNVSRKSESGGYVSYSAYHNFPAKEGTVSLWVKRQGGGTYNSFLGAGNALWGKNGLFNIFYDVTKDNLYFRYRGSKKDHLDIVLKGKMQEKVWYQLIASWKYNEATGKMHMTAWKISGAGGKPEKGEAEVLWSAPFTKALYVFGAKGELCLGSSRKGLTPANSLIDEVFIWDKALTFDEVKKAEQDILKDKAGTKVSSSAKKESGRQISLENIKSFDGWGRMLLPVPEIAEVPVIDGKIEKELFEKITTLNSNFILDRMIPATNNTKIGIARNGDNLYLAVKCFYGTGKGLTANVDKRDGPVFFDDCIELHIYSKSSKENVHFIVNPRGTLFDEKDRESAWNSTIKVAAAKENGAWNAELLIPVSSLKIGDFSDLKINVARNDKTVVPGELSCLVPLKGKKFYQPNRFAELLLIPDAKGFDIRHGFIAGPAGQSGFNATLNYPGFWNKAKVSDVVFSTKTLKIIEEKDAIVGGQKVSFDHFLRTTEPVVEQFIVQKDGAVLANVAQIFRTQAKVKKVSGKLDSSKYLWLKNKIGKQHSVPSPFLPVKYEDSQVKVVLRDYSLKGEELINKIIADDNDLLAGSIKLLGQGKKSIVFGKPKVVKRFPDRLIISRSAVFKGKSVGKLKMTVDFDGFIWNELELENVSLDRLTLNIPLNPKVIYNLDSSVPVNVAKNEQIKLLKPGQKYQFRFMPSIWLGSEKCGFAFFAESDKGWKNANLRKVYEVDCRKNVYYCNVNFINGKTDIKKAVYSWGIMATPTKPVKRSVNREMAWVDIHYPQAMEQKLQDYPGQEKDFIKWLAGQGVKVVVLFDYWARYQGGHIATYPETVKRVVKKCHKNGIKVLLYRSRELSTADPYWNDFSARSLAMPTSYGYRRSIPVKQISYGYCPESLMQDYFVWSCDWLMKEYNVDGFYLDSPAHPSACFNDAHGCGYKQEDGSKHVTFPVLATREMIKRLYRVVKKYKADGLIDAHGPFTPAEGFLTSRFIGEQYYKMRHYDKDPLKVIPLDIFRALFLTRGMGTSVNMLLYCGCPFSPDEAAAMAFINGVTPRPHSLQGPEGRNVLMKIAPIWRALNKFGTDDAEWVPYWDKKFAALSWTVPRWLGKQGKVKVSYYKKGNDYLFLIANYGVHACRVNLTAPDFKNGIVGAVDMLSGKPVSKNKDVVWTLADPYKLKLIKISTAK